MRCRGFKTIDSQANILFFFLINRSGMEKGKSAVNFWYMAVAFIAAKEKRGMF